MSVCSAVDTKQCISVVWHCVRSKYSWMSYSYRNSWMFKSNILDFIILCYYSMCDLVVVDGCYFGQCVHVQCIDAYPCTCCGNVRLCVVSIAPTANVKAEIDDVFILQYLVIWRRWLEATNPILLKKWLRFCCLVCACSTSIFIAKVAKENPPNSYVQ